MLFSNIFSITPSLTLPFSPPCVCACWPLSIHTWPVLSEHHFFPFFVPQVSQHRTKETFGRALIPLNKDEYPWFCHFIPCRHNLPCCDSKTFFANSNDGPFTNLLKSFQASWKCFGLPGMPMFTPVRSSISTCVRPVLFNWIEYEPLLFRSSPS